MEYECSKVFDSMRNDILEANWNRRRPWYRSMDLYMNHRQTKNRIKVADGISFLNVLLLIYDTITRSQYSWSTSFTRSYSRSRVCVFYCVVSNVLPDSKLHGTNMGPTWFLSAPGGPHVGPINLAIRAIIWLAFLCLSSCCIRNNGPPTLDLSTSSWWDHWLDMA